ncbi:MAG: sigma-54-dependent Fis family transcriptional regulator, partial [Chitinivibrionales bacterium]|nr:sigma-54-dependent Fis family transcriptional regulator [Chitinivibrionales bacterium]
GTVALPTGDGTFPTLEDMERRHIELALQRFDRNYTEVAKRLGISRSTLWRKLKAYNLESEQSRETSA